MSEAQIWFKEMQLIVGINYLRHQKLFLCSYIRICFVSNTNDSSLDHCAYPSLSSVVLIMLKT